ncbi:hypothetical protein HMSSN036_45830 [Paenibacillus macerans]|nr:hypothetical protein HMSSN036_45830 [Paenibacillus macerans]
MGAALEAADEQLPDYLLARGRCYLDWIGPAIVRHRSAAELRRFAGLPEQASAALPDDASDWHVAFVSSREVAQTGSAEAAAAMAAGPEGTLPDTAALKALLSGGPAAVQPASPADAKLRREVAARLDWTYSYAAASRISAKRR